MTRPELERHALRLAFLVACLGALWSFRSDAVGRIALHADHAIPARVVCER